MAFSPSSATLTAAAPHQPHLASEYDYTFTDGSRTPTKAQSYAYYDSETAHSSVAGSQAGPSLATGEAQDLTHLLPTTDRKKNQYIPVALRLPILIGVPLSLLLLAVGLEVAILFSQRHNGFSVPEKNVISFASAQFLLSFVPTMQVVIVIPPAWFYRGLDWHIRWYQPYVVMSRGNAKPQESVLLDYVTLGPVFSIINSAKFKHRVITWSTLTALATYIMQPLAGSMFQVQNLYIPTDTTVNSTRVIGLADFSDLTAFVSSAGFAEAAVFNSLPDPPFIRNSWTIARFEFPSKDYLNGTMTVNTTAIQTTTNCLGPEGIPSLTATDGGFIINSTSADGCTQTAEASNTDVSSQQYGVVNVPDTCSQLNITQRPVMFWYGCHLAFTVVRCDINVLYTLRRFFHHAADGSPEARTVFCKPTLQLFNVQVTANSNNQSVIGVLELDSNVPSNNVTGPFANSPFNGVIFENQTDPFIQARATATTNGVPGAIFRFAAQSPGGADAVFSADNSFLDITNTVYTLYLAVVAQSIYFVPQDSTLAAQLSSITLRLTINPLSGHALAFFLFFIGLVGVLVHIISQKQRRGLYLATPPGTIAATIALSAHSGFGELLMPTDDEATLERKLSGLRFSIDNRTGAIVATAASVSSSSRDSKRMSSKPDPDEMMQSLLGSEYKRPPNKVRMGSDLSASSSQAAFEAASTRVGYPPMRSPRGIS
ncbi:hypothetical protein F5876DRAFT_74183 [Lentinula aff. lateritia]|uniref:Uncharacterized protein n=1 Tax=Lentinula aff. lateritia TaxID=2804960 RepID=A0ACC1U952_9AGAR|nr:hypothetical protein F5876DRAFT_74183 [Lentinula aff. lateritia]